MCSTSISAEVQYSGFVFEHCDEYWRSVITLSVNLKKSTQYIEENPQISLIFLRQSIGYYSAALRKRKNRILTIRKWGMYLVYNKRLKKSKKENNRYIFFLSLYYKRESLCTNICQLWVLILLVMRTMQNWYCNYRSEIFLIENPCKNVASQWNRFGLNPEVQSRRTKYFSKRKTDRMRLLTA